MWFRNHYRCARCGKQWSDEWSAMCDDDCPHCGARHMSPHDSDDLTTVVAPKGTGSVVHHSPDTAEHDPAYQELAEFPTRGEAEAFAAAA